MIQTSTMVASQHTRTARKSRPRAKAAKPPIIQVRNLEKTYTTVRGSLTLFQGLSLDVKAGEMVAIVGQSGAGKSTLLHILGSLDTPTAGTVTCVSVNVAQLSPQEAAAFRNREIGYVWQFHYLLPEFSALENVAMPLLARGVGRRTALNTAANWLREVDLADRGSHRPGELSGGEQQRVALARALVNNPRLLLADEPTGDLDTTTAGRVFDLIERLHKSHGLTSIIVTHNMELAARARRILRLEAGKLASVQLAALTAYTPQAGVRAGKK
ncbi:MAG TPA: ABC transporter ATP-binding protein [Terracidiphilus sp.]|nr:ABC transporter ATP-binding protein [Terracidiphilus sp.]